MDSPGAVSRSISPYQTSCPPRLSGNALLWSLLPSWGIFPETEIRCPHRVKYGILKCIFMVFSLKKNDFGLVFKFKITSLWTIQLWISPKKRFKKISNVCNDSINPYPFYQNPNTYLTFRLLRNLNFLLRNFFLFI